jgi:centromere protein C
MYFIENIGQRDAKIFFTQARKTMNDDDERLIALANRDRKRQRSSSAGAMATRRTSAAPSNDATPLTARTNSRR